MVCLFPSAEVYALTESERVVTVIGMKFLIFGVTGRVGSVAARRLKERGHEVIACSRHEADLCNGENTEKLIEATSPECVLNCAAVSGIETALDDPLTAHRVNAVAPGMMARAAHRMGIRYIHLSTDYVLDGKRKGLKNETAKCRPCCVYAEKANTRGNCTFFARCPKRPYYAYRGFVVTQ